MTWSHDGLTHWGDMTMDQKIGWCYEEGYSSAQRGNGKDTCPFHTQARTVDLEDGSERVPVAHWMGIAWLRGWADARTMAAVG